MYNALRDKKRYFLVSYCYNNGYGNKLCEDTCINIRKIEAEIKNRIGKDVVAISITELTKQEYKLSMEYNVEISIEHVQGCIPRGDESIQMFIPGKYTGNGYLDSAISFNGCELIPKDLRK